MKGYLLILLTAALLLLLLPLPALLRQTPAHPTMGEPTESSASLPEHDPQPEPDTAPAQGSFRILCGEKVVTLTVREFLIRTLAFEMAPTYHTEALKAQAVAAYTYYGRRRTAQETAPEAHLKGAHFATPDSRFPEDFSPEALQQRWGADYERQYTKLCEAVDAVLGKAMTFDGNYIDACYFSISNGCTESAAIVWGSDIPYLQAVASPGDRLAPDYASTVTLTSQQVRDALTAAPSITLPEDPAAWFGEPVLSQAGTVVSLPVGNGSLPGTKLREYLGLRSATFSIAYAQGQFTFSVRGYGHGVGMSQYGADHLARQGYTWEEILHYYYTDVTITG